MSRQRVRRGHGSVRRAVAAVLIFGIASMAVPASADPAASGEVRPLAGIGSPQQLRNALEQSGALDARRLAMTEQAGVERAGSGRRCVGGLALLAGGVAAAVISGVRRDDNPQKPSPPVGVVLGTAAGVVGGVLMLKSCRR